LQFEISPNSRAKCYRCHNIIQKGEVRVETLHCYNYILESEYLHFKCFLKDNYLKEDALNSTMIFLSEYFRNNIEALQLIEKLKHFSQIQEISSHIGKKEKGDEKNESI